MEKYDMFDLLKGLEDKNNKIRGVFDCEDFLDKEISILWAIIEWGYGFNGSDEVAQILHEFGNGEITKKQAQRKIKLLPKD